MGVKTMKMTRKSIHSIVTLLLIAFTSSITMEAALIVSDHAPSAELESLPKLDPAKLDQSRSTQSTHKPDLILQEPKVQEKPQLVLPSLQSPVVTEKIQMPEVQQPIKQPIMPQIQKPTETKLSNGEKLYNQHMFSGKIKRAKLSSKYHSNPLVRFWYKIKSMIWSPIDHLTNFIVRKYRTFAMQETQKILTLEEGVSGNKILAKGAVIVTAPLVAKFIYSKFFRNPMVCFLTSPKELGGSLIQNTKLSKEFKTTVDKIAEKQESETEKQFETRQITETCKYFKHFFGKQLFHMLTPWIENEDTRSDHYEKTVATINATIYGANLIRTISSIVEKTTDNVALLYEIMQDKYPTTRLHKVWNTLQIVYNTIESIADIAIVVTSYEKAKTNLKKSYFNSGDTEETTEVTKSELYDRFVVIRLMLGGMKLMLKGIGQAIKVVKPGILDLDSKFKAINWPETHKRIKKLDTVRDKISDVSDIHPLLSPVKQMTRQFINTPRTLQDKVQTMTTSTNMVKMGCSLVKSLFSDSDGKESDLDLSAFGIDSDQLEQIDLDSLVDTD